MSFLLPVLKQLTTRQLSLRYLAMDAHVIKHYVCMSTRPITNVDMNIFNQLGHCKCLNLTSNPVVQNIQKLFLMEYACYTIQSHSDNMTVQYQQSGDQQHKTVHQWVSSVSKKLKSRREMIRISNLNSMLCYECFTWHHEVWCHKVFKSCIQRVVKCKLHAYIHTHTLVYNKFINAHCFCQPKWFTGFVQKYTYNVHQQYVYSLSGLSMQTAIECTLSSKHQLSTANNNFSVLRSTWSFSLAQCSWRTCCVQQEGTNKLNPPRSFNPKPSLPTKNSTNPTILALFLWH